jgi:hypothetical protein
MENSRILITVASWEDRFIDGLKLNMNEYIPNTIYMPYFKGYASWTEENRLKAKALADKMNVELCSFELDFETPHTNWKDLEAKLNIAKSKDLKTGALIDISTMPRDIIYFVLYFLELQNIPTSYIYYIPKEYPTDWLSRNPRKPRLIYKLSGQSALGQPTALLCVAGYDKQRLYNLYNHFEPKQLFLGLQEGGSFKDTNMDSNQDYFEYFANRKNCTTFQFNAYDAEKSYPIIESYIRQNKDDYNIVLSSLGPKPTAIYMYMLARQYPQVALSYISAKEYNRNYSSGISEKVEGKMDW